ncbi:TetR family transcriptional regulator [Paraburkholderia xenovorans]|uniref:TetR family transcriptional regulator n=1 Tax=Paraburkholderia xenovorans TaxID=36873 RepID=UPI0038B9AB74
MYRGASRHDRHRLKHMKRTKAQAWDTRAKILDAAEAVFFSHGVTQTTLDEIADAAGVTRGAIYGHFRNKDAVFDAIFERFALPLDPFTIPLPEDESDPLGTLKVELEARLSRALRDTRTRRLYGIVFSRCEATESTALFFHRVRSASRLAEAQIERVLCHAVAREQLSADFNAYEAALFIHATLTGVFRKDLLRRRRDTRLDPGRIVSVTFRCLTQH